MYLYHGTTVPAARRIAKEEFKTDKKYNWGVTSKKGFVYLSKAYAPFYAMTAKGQGNNRAIVKVSVPAGKLYPEDDFIMAALGKPHYTQADINAINLEDYKQYAPDSLQYMGNAAAKPKDIKVVGVTEFDAKRLLFVCDPVIAPINYKIMGNYYEGLTEWIYKGGKPEEFKKFGVGEKMKW